VLKKLRVIKEIILERKIDAKKRRKKKNYI
jgi:hypothetical protein